jgi:hypothetical protein
MMGLPFVWSHPIGNIKNIEEGDVEASGDGESEGIGVGDISMPYMSCIIIHWMWTLLLD